MIKRIISIFVAILVISSTVYIPAFSETVQEQDNIKYYAPGNVIINENFDNGDVGETISGYVHGKRNADNKNEPPTDSPDYTSFTYSYGVGTNTTNVGKLYDRSYRFASVKRYTLDGEDDLNAVNDVKKNMEWFKTSSNVLSGLSHINVKFKYYNPITATQNDEPRDKFILALMSSSNNRSSSTGTIEIMGDKMTVYSRTVSASDNKTITGLPTKEWVDVEYDFVADTAERKAYITVNAGGKKTEGIIENYDLPQYIYITLQEYYGGTFFIDDLVVTEYEDPSKEFKTAVESLTFDALSDGTSNTMNNVYESWAEGFPTTCVSGDNSFDIEWTSSNPNAISTTGLVTQRSYAQKVTLTAKIKQSSRVYAERTYDLIVSPISGADTISVLEEYAQQDVYASKYIKDSTDTPESIKNDILPLPTRDDAANIDIAWTAEPEGIINLSTGEVTRPSFEEEDAVVTLTASLTRDGVPSPPITKSIQYTVVKKPNPNSVIADVIDNMVITEEPYDKITSDLTLPGKSGDVSILWDTTNHSQISTDGAVTRGDAEVTGTIKAALSLDGTTVYETYTLTVLPTIQKMLEKDVELIDKTGWNALTTDFNVPLVGEKYGSILTWSSTSEYIKVDNNGTIKVKRPPNSFEDNVSASLVVTAKLGNDEKTMSIPVIVLKQENDITIAQNAADTINFDMIRGVNNTQDAVTSNLSIPNSFVYDKSLSIEWESSDENVVKVTGEVIRPLPGAGDKTITLTAKVKKNYSYSTPVVIGFTVKALADDNELLQQAKDALTFSALSSEEIDNVTKNLTLPSEGKYGTTIEWTSNSSIIVVSGAEGIVTSPEWGQANGVALLNAAISYNDKTVYKTFNITVPEKETFEEKIEFWDEDYNDWTEEYNFSSAAENGSWVVPDIVSGTRAYVCPDTNNLSNVYIAVARENRAAVGYLNYTNYEIVEGPSINVGMKFYVADDFESVATAEVFSRGDTSSPVIAFIDGANSIIEVVSDNSGVIKTLKLSSATFNKNSWNDLKFVINTRTKKFNVYLNGECISESGEVVLKETGEQYEISEGIPFSSSAATNVKGVKWTIEDGVICIDDTYINTYALHTADQKRASEIWEKEFLSTVDINCIKKTFTTPDLKIDGMTIKIESGNSNILNIQGGIKVVYYSPLTQVTPIPLYACFDNGKTTYKKKYVLYVYPPDEIEVGLSDTESVDADIKSIVDYIRANYNLSNLKFNIPLKDIIYHQGSTISFSSSDENIMTDEGVVNLIEKMQNVRLTITAKKGTAIKSETLSIYVGTKSQSGNNTPTLGGGGGGGGGGRPVYGENTNPQSGIDIGQPEDSEENQGTASEFTDVSKEHWAYNQINFLVEKKILNGVGDGRIEPERTIKREEFVKMLVMALEPELKEATADFSDVDADEWYAPYVATIKAKGLVNGFEDGTFGIGQNISRQDLAVLIYRSSNLAKETVKNVFADDAEIADYAKDAVYTLKDLGIINGKGDGKFDPKASATRAETATMLYKAIKQNLFE